MKATAPSPLSTIKLCMYCMMLCLHMINESIALHDNRYMGFTHGSITFTSHSSIIRMVTVVGNFQKWSTAAG